MKRSIKRLSNKASNSCQIKKLCFLTGLLLVIGIIGGCAAPTREYSDPLADVGITRTKSHFSTLGLGVIFSENVQKSMDLMRENIAKIKSLGIFQNRSALEDSNPHYLTEGLNRILGSRFKEVSRVSRIEELQTQGLDLGVVLDIRIKLGSRSGDKTTVFVSAAFIGRDKSIIDTISGTGTGTIPFPASTFGFKVAVNSALQLFSQSLDGSAKLTVALKHLADHKHQIAGHPSRPEPAVAPPPQHFAARSGSQFAVVIGISNYGDSQIPALRYASSDARAFHQWLISARGGKHAPSQVKLLLNENATGKSIRDALFNWLGQALEEDTVTIYFAGHGSPQSPDAPKNLFLLPYDADYSNVATTGFPMWDIEIALKRFIKAKKVVVIADACHAGGVGQGFDVARRSGRAIKRNRLTSAFQDLSKVGDGICVISASDDNQLSQEGQQWGGGHGVFTHFLLQGLKGEADYNRDGNVSLGELIPYLSENVRRATKNAQSPTVAGKFDPALSIGR